MDNKNSRYERVFSLHTYILRSEYKTVLLCIRASRQFRLILTLSNIQVYAADDLEEIKLRN